MTLMMHLFLSLINFHGTIYYGLTYVSNGDIQLYGYTDADWAGSVEDKNSTSEGFFSSGYSMIRG